MSDILSKPSTAFEGSRRLASGPLIEVALAVKTAVEKGSSNSFLVFDDTTGRVVDLDLRGTKADLIKRLSRHPRAVVGSCVADRTTVLEQGKKEEASESRGRGRPKLGVVAREVTLLPRQWEWLATQPGGASAVLRRLVDEAKRSGVPQQERRAAQEAAYRFMLAIAGDLPGYEEATRALFADDRPKLKRCIAHWPKDIRTHALGLAFGSSDRSSRK